MESEVQEGLNQELAVIPSLEDRIEALEETVRGLNGDLSELTALVHGMRMHIPGPIYLPKTVGSRADGSLLHDHADPASCGCYAAGLGDGRQEVRREVRREVGA